MTASSHAQTSPLDRRRLGVLLHPTSLPGPGSNGTLGPNAFHFVDFMCYAGISVWQVLPLGPTHADRSPYQCTSAHAGDPRLINLKRLQEWGWLPEPDFDQPQTCLHTAFAQFRDRADATAETEFAAFCKEQCDWLDDFALFSALKNAFDGAPWWEWPVPLRDREYNALASHRDALAESVEQARFEQYVFFRQWADIKRYANERGILLFGDMPIFVALDSADVWAQRDLFQLDATGQPTVVAGVPPDYFSATGQLWGNPHYNWERLRSDGFAWWQCRMRSQLAHFDLIRIDHFRGFEACWAIPIGETTAINGQWVAAPGEELFTRLLMELGQLSLIAEDLGVITPAVEQLRDHFAFPGMKILQFAYGNGPDNPYLAHNHTANSVVYTGTHDNDTTLGWFGKIDDAERSHLLAYLGQPQEPMPWPLIRQAMASVARLAVIPMQDFLGLDTTGRMNSPGTKDEKNWRWRFEWEDIPQNTVEHIRELAHLYGREASR